MGPLATDGWTSKTSGLDRVVGKIDAVRRAPQLGAVVSAGPSSGEYRRKDGRSDHETRTAGENITILRSQAKDGRKLAVLDAGQRTRIEGLWAAACRAVISSGSAAALYDAARRVAEETLRAYRARPASGELSAVAESTQERKDREGYAKGLPPLVRTGQLLRSLIASVRQR